MPVFIIFFPTSFYRLDCPFFCLIYIRFLLKSLNLIQTIYIRFSSKNIRRQIASQKHRILYNYINTGNKAKVGLHWALFATFGSGKLKLSKPEDLRQIFTEFFCHIEVKNKRKFSTRFLLQLPSKCGPPALCHLTNLALAWNTDWQVASCHPTCQNLYVICETKIFVIL